MPTWNYVAVHAHGHARVIESVDVVFDTMKTLVVSNEVKYGTGWTMSRNPELEKLGNHDLAAWMKATRP